MGWLKNAIEFVIENNAISVLSRAVTGDETPVKKTNGNIDLFEERKLDTLKMTTSAGLIGSNPLSQISGGISFGKEQKKYMLPFVIVVGVVLILIVRPFGLLSGRKRRR